MAKILERVMKGEDFECLWPNLKDSIKEIQNKNNSELSFEELYRQGYLMVLNKHGSKLYEALEKQIIQHLESNVRGPILYSINNNLVGAIHNAWTEHCVIMNMIRDILMYFERIYIEKNSDIHNVYDLGIVLFKDHIFKYEHISDVLRQTILQQVMDERNGAAIDRIMMKTVLTMLMGMGLDSRSFYEEYFEDAFFKQTREFYIKFRQEGLQLYTPSEYIEKALVKKKEEFERCQHYLDQITTKHLVDIVYTELIIEPMEMILQMEDAGMVHMLKNKQTKELAQLYELYANVENSFPIMSNCFIAFLESQEKSMLKDVENMSDFIKNLIDLGEYLDLVVEKSFQSNELLKDVCFTGIIRILNVNKSKSSEALSLFIHSSLNKKGLAEIDKEALLEKALFLFKYLEDKDAFEFFYKKHFAKRLLLNQTVSDETEKYMISKMKVEYGSQFANQVHQMYQDISVSETLMGEFKEHESAQMMKVNKMELDMKVLTCVHWPVSGTPPPCLIPIEIQLAFAVFTNFYISKHNGKKLTLLPNLGSADLNATFVSYKKPESDKEVTCLVKKIPRKYIINVSTYQMTVLMLFNKKTEYTFVELEIESGIPAEQLAKSIKPLIFGKPSCKLLIKTPKTEEFNANDVLTINNNYSSKSVRVKIPVLFKKTELKEESDSTMKKVDESRRLAVDAAVVRIMKAHRKLNHNTLVTEILKQKDTMKFTPQPDLISKRVEILIQKEYIARGEKKDIYVYLE